jgi:uncharacterized protein YijF (DUF1287 family)
MSRRPSRSSGFYDTIEYVGPRPQKPQKKRRFFGGWVILVIAVGIPLLFTKQILQTVRAEQEGTSLQSVDLAIERLKTAGDSGSLLAAAALSQVRYPASYDDSYYKIDFPNGDIPADKGKAEDVIIRAYRALGIDLQQLVHDDMAKSFREYEQLFKASGPDTNIDHRRAPNLKRFFERNGETLSASRNPADYQYGDIVILTRPSGRSETSSRLEMHIAIIVPGPGDRTGSPWIVHNLDSGVKWEDTLLSYQIIGHYRYAR